MNTFKLITIASALALLLACDSSTGSAEIQPNPETATTEDTVDCCVGEPVTQTLLPEGDTWNTNQLAFDLYNQVALTADADKNFVFSPTSIALALGMLHGGADGVTKDEISYALELHLADEGFHLQFQELTEQLLSRNLDTQEQPEALLLNIQNAAWLDLGFSADPGYLDLLQNSYQARVDQLNIGGDPEGARQTINNAVLEETNGLIEELLPQYALDSLTQLVLTNTVYFKGQWRTAFDEYDTYERPFYNLDATVSAPDFMAATLRARHGRQEDVQVVALPYANEDLEMVIFLPEEGGMQAFESKLEPGTIAQFMAQLTQGAVQLELPKFKLAHTMETKDVLERLGVIDAFDELAADLSRMTPADNGLFVKDAFHQATIEVNEAGSEASAATAIVINDRSAAQDSQSIKSIIINRPFVFGIYDRPTQSFLFLGRVVSL